MVRTPIVSLFVPSVFLFASLNACGGNEPPAQSPQASTPAAPAPAAAKPGPSAPGAGDEAWEGEAEAKTGAAAPDDPNAKGAETRSNEVIAKVIKDNRKPFRDCFEAGAKELPDLEGTMTIHFVLDPAGKVKTAELNGARSTIQAASIVNCAVAVLKLMKFPASSRGMESVVNYPFDFKR